MYILAIETTGAFASVALAKAEGRKQDTAKAYQSKAGSTNADSIGQDVQVLATVHGHDRFSHLQNLTPQIKQVLDECKLAIGDVDAIAVSRGPGSFTGIRIGVSTARALAQVTGKPCIGVSSLEALAMRAASEVEAEVATEAAAAETLICPILDARRSQVYGGGYFVDNGSAKEEIQAGPYTIEEFVEQIKDYKKVLFVGDGIDAYREKIEEIRTEGTDFGAIYQDAEQVAILGARLAAEGKTCSFEELKPEYMRLAEAERKLREKQADKREAGGLREKKNG